MPVVVATGRVARVREPGRVGKPADRRRPRVRDLVGEVLAGHGVDDPQCRALVAGRGCAVCDEAAVARRMEPVDRRGLVVDQPGGVDDDRGRRGDDAVERTNAQDGLVVVAPPVEREEASAFDARRARRAGAEQLGQTGVEARAGRNSIERRPSTGILRGRPLDGFKRVAVFEPPIGVANLDPVDQLSRGRRSACVRGWPCSCAPSACASRFSST